MEWQIWAVRTGVVWAPPAVSGASSPAATVETPLVAWVLRSALGAVVIDPGASPEAAAARPHLRYQSGTSVDQALTLLGIPAEDVLGTLLTHAHWDHASALVPGDFPVMMSRRERAVLESPPPTQAPAYLSSVPIAADRIAFVAEGDIVFEGIDILDLPGHTDGSIGTQVATGKGAILIAGDLVGHRDQLEISPWRAPHIASDHMLARQSMDRISRLFEADNILPAHDMSLFEGSDVERVC